MTQRTLDKKQEIESYLRELDEIMPESFEEYNNSLTKKLACERVFEKIAEAITDLAFIVIKYKKLETPTDDKQAFEILAEEGIIPDDLKISLKDARGMRNILAHQYGDVDDEIVYKAITEEIRDDARKFLNILFSVQL